MAGPISCTCGALLVEDSDSDGVTLVGGERVRFRRKTDFVVCQECLSVYNASQLLEGGQPEESYVDKLEAMMESGEAEVE